MKVKWKLNDKLELEPETNHDYELLKMLKREIDNINTLKKIQDPKKNTYDFLHSDEHM